MKIRTLAGVAVLAVAGLAGCASTPSAQESAAVEQHQVSRPASYGTMGGYRYRRLIVTPVAGS